MLKGNQPQKHEKTMFIDFAINRRIISSIKIFKVVKFLHVYLHSVYIRNDTVTIFQHLKSTFGKPRKLER